MALEKLDVYWPILILMAFGVLLVVGALIVSKIISPQKPTELKRQAYECGEDPVGDAWALFNMRLYVIGLIFIIFEFPFTTSSDTICEGHHMTPLLPYRIGVQTSWTRSLFTIRLIAPVFVLSSSKLSVTVSIAFP